MAAPRVLPDSNIQTSQSLLSDQVLEKKSDDQKKNDISNLGNPKLPKKTSFQQTSLLRPSPTLSPHSQTHRSHKRVHPDLQISKNRNYLSDSICKVQSLRTVARRMLLHVRARMQKSLRFLHFYLINDRAGEICAAKEEEGDDGIYERKIEQVFANSHLRINGNNSNRSSLLSTTLEDRKGFLHTQFQKLPVFSPSSPFRLVWDVMQLFVIVYFSYFALLHIATGQSIQELTTLHVITIILFALLGADIVVQANSGFYERGICICDRYIVTAHYLRTNFAFDLFVLVTLIIGEYYFEWLMLLFYTKQSAVETITKRLSDVLEKDERAHNLAQLIKLFFKILLMAHVFACIWIYIAQFSDQSWMNARNIKDDNWGIQYLNAFYFIVVTMCTVGYGDIAAHNTLEVGIAIITIFFSCGMFAFSLNTIGSIIQSFQRQEQAFASQLLLINQYMRRKRISLDLQIRIRQYLEYSMRQDGQQDGIEIEKIVSKLSDDLQSKLSIEANKVLLMDSPIFRHNFSPKILEKCVKIIKESNFQPETILPVHGEEDDPLLHFIENGRLEQLLVAKGFEGERRAQRLRILRDGDQVGEDLFFTGLQREQRSLQVKAIEFTKVLTLKRSDFMTLLQEFPHDMEAFCMMRDQLLYQNYCLHMQQRCHSCQNSNHNFVQCPLLHYTPDPYAVIKRYILEPDFQERDTQFVRKAGKINQNALSIMYLLTSKAIDFNDFNETFLHEKTWIMSEPSLTDSSFTQDSDDSMLSSVSEFKKQSFQAIKKNTQVVQLITQPRKSRYSIFQGLAGTLNSINNIGNVNKNKLNLQHRQSRLFIPYQQYRISRQQPENLSERLQQEQNNIQKNRAISQQSCQMVNQIQQQIPSVQAANSESSYELNTSNEKDVMTLLQQKSSEKQINEIQNVDSEQNNNILPNSKTDINNIEQSQALPSIKLLPIPSIKLLPLPDQIQVNDQQKKLNIKRVTPLNGNNKMKESNKQYCVDRENLNGVTDSTHKKVENAEALRAQRKKTAMAQRKNSKNLTDINRSLKMRKPKYPTIIIPSLGKIKKEKIARDLEPKIKSNNITSHRKAIIMAATPFDDGCVYYGSGGKYFDERKDYRNYFPLHNFKKTIQRYIRKHSEARQKEKIILDQLLNEQQSNNIEISSTQKQQKAITPKPKNRFLKKIQHQIDAMGRPSFKKRGDEGTLLSTTKMNTTEGTEELNILSKYVSPQASILRLMPGREQFQSQNVSNEINLSSLQEQISGAQRLPLLLSSQSTTRRTSLSLINTPIPSISQQKNHLQRDNITENSEEEKE